jgi:hypothetical protein
LLGERFGATGAGLSFAFYFAHLPHPLVWSGLSIQLIELLLPVDLILLDLFPEVIDIFFNFPLPLYLLLFDATFSLSLSPHSFVNVMLSFFDDLC